MFTDKIALKDFDKMDSEYKDLLGRVLTIQADCEIGGPHLYVETMLPAAPTKLDQLIVARTAAEEIDHYRKVAHVAGDIGVDVSFVLSQPNEKRFVDTFRGLITTWEDNAVFGFLIDRVGRYQLEEFYDCSYLPLQRILPDIVTEELAHIEYGYNKTKELIDKGEVGKQKAQKAVDYWYVRALDMFGRSGSTGGSSMKRIRNRAKSSLIIAATVFWFCLGTNVSAQLTKLNVGYVGINSDNVIAFIAKETGIFAKNGLDVQLIYFDGGSTAAMSLISGETPIIQTGGPSIVNAVLAGADAVMIAGGVTTLDYWMLSRPEVKTAEQLKGGAVAISRFGSSSDFIVRYALQRIGLTPVKDVAILQVGPLPDRLAAMETNRVQATVLAPPAMYMAQKRGYNILADVAALGLAYQATGVGTTRKYIREHPDIVRKYIKSQIDAVHRFKTDRESSIRVLSKYLSLKEKDILDKTYDGAIAENKLPAKQYPTLEGIKTILEPMKNDPKAKAAKPEDFVDMRFIKELDESGYIDRLYKGK